MTKLGATLRDLAALADRCPVTLDQALRQLERREVEQVATALLAREAVARQIVTLGRELR